MLGSIDYHGGESQAGTEVGKNYRTSVSEVEHSPDVGLVSVRQTLILANFLIQSQRSS